MKKKQFFNTTVILESGKHYDLTKLNHLISKYTNTIINQCKICKKNSAVTTRELSKHIFIDTDFMSQNGENKYSLNDIPAEIITQNFRYDV